jgi:hypothetical protein
MNNTYPILTQHLGYVAKLVGCYKRVGKHLRPYLTTGYGEADLAATIAAIRQEHARQEIIRAARRAARETAPGSQRLPGSGWARRQWLDILMLRRLQRAEDARLAAEAAEQAHKTALDRQRRRIAARLRKLGFRLDRRQQGGSGSTYYALGLLAVRISDHEVPMTEDRQCARENGKHTWARSRWSFVLGQDDESDWLESIADAVGHD